MIDIAISAILYIVFMAFAAKRSLTYMHVLQQEEYDNVRLVKWIFEHNAYDKRVTAGLFFLGIFALMPQYIPTFFINFLVFMALVTATYLEIDPRKNSKKKLVSTSRAKRIYFPSLVLIYALGCLSFFSPHPWLWIFCVQMIPVVILLVNLMLQPIEDIIQQMYWNEAHEKVMRLKPVVIGVTGSFGKTSVKHILGHILKAHGNTLMTPGSVNTPMGIARIIREKLNEDVKYFIVEMGAYGPGSIARLCRLTPPDHGIITAIGHAHYERFKSLENVSVAKYELAEAVLKKPEGNVIVHERTLRFPHPRNIRLNNLDRIIVCGDAPDVGSDKKKEVSYIQEDDLHVKKILQMPDGLEIQISWQGQEYNLNAPLYGTHHGHNVALAFATAMSMGFEASDIMMAIEKLPQIEHRLEVRKQADLTIIDDAYNSNPLGFRSALDLMSILSKEGRKILITPGIVELGIAHDEVHTKLGQYAAEVCDVVIVVNPERIQAFVKGFNSKGSGKTLIEVATFEDANSWINKNKQANDVVLIENDLPDIYERIPKM